jgi:hypothetical protein
MTSADLLGGKASTSRISLKAEALVRFFISSAFMPFPIRNPKSAFRNYSREVLN